MNLTQLETPALVADEKIFKENIEAMSKLLEGKLLKVRPHYKSNKCHSIAHMQIKAGAVGITCAKLSEAEDLCDSGIENILIANQIVDPDKIARVAVLAKKCHLIICVDAKENAEMLSKAAVNAGSTIYCYVELEVGMKRCGVGTEEEFVALAKHIRSLENLEFAGIQAYQGHVSHMVTEEERKEYTFKIFETLSHLKKTLEAEGFEHIDISGGSTGTSVIKAESNLYTELQAGSYIFLDATYNQLTNLPFRNSLYVLATVISKRGDLTILDCGVKGMGVDQGLPLAFTLDGKKIETREMELNEEHLKLFSPSVDLKLGDKVLLIPGHCCSTVNLYEKLYMFKDKKVTDRLQISARGCSR